MSAFTWHFWFTLECLREIRGIRWEDIHLDQGYGVVNCAVTYPTNSKPHIGKPGEYITFKQCRQEDGKVRKGEKAQMVVFWKFIEQEDEETHEKKQVPFLRYCNVLHIDQCEGLTAERMSSKVASWSSIRKAGEGHLLWL